tara:strand:+ start:710 stop:925 length:216 start_codon:yes stop_codon:yes gene_type:complete
MKSIIILLKNIKNLLPYIILIAIYFFFVNLEAIKETDNNIFTDKENSESIEKSIIDDKELRIKIPVIPYTQ